MVLGSFAASASVVEDLPQPVEGNMQDTPESVLRNSVIEPRVGMEFGSLLEVTEFYKKHFATFRRISTDTRRRLLINDNAGVRVNSSIKSSIVEAGGYENVTYNEKDVRNFLDKECCLKCREGDGQALHDYFVRMQGKNSNFYHALDLDDELRVRNVFWVDARSRAAYESFHDVITFDTTYLTNKYDMPFAPFIGINHHGESIILGYGLLSGEDTDLFVWVFRQWLQSMCGIAPKAIITDQCQAMRWAIEIVFPETVHRWCIWHITMKLPWKSLKSRGIIPSLHIIFKENEWLANLYEERERWVPAFLNSNFFAGMSSTQRSESMNAFFDDYLHSSTTLKVFMEQFENALRNKGCIVKKVVRGGEEVKYKIQDEAATMRFFEVRFSSSECLVGCVCRMFEFKGILCRHALFVLSQKSVTVLLERYEKLHRLAISVLEIGVESVVNFNVLEKTEVVRSPMVVKRKGRPRTKRLKSSMEEAVSKPKKKRNTAAARNVGGSAYGDGSTSNMSMSQSQAHGYEDEASNLT
uniref:SWIM-type domain-containing protein n=1 Tax=Fagus sylvatica TaxID=28930 RepID=A0A2N9F1B9_FAGSY